MHIATLGSHGLLRVTGEDARSFLHAQLTVDVEALPAGQARYAGWCSAKGRLLATFLVIPAPGGFLLQLAGDLAAPVAKRLGMFVLRAKVRIADESHASPQFGVWGADAEGQLRASALPVPPEVLGVAGAGETQVVRLGQERFVVIGPAALAPNATTQEWSLLDVRAGVPQITLATQDSLVPQMANLELLGAVDFRKGCYPGQEIVARAQYRGAVKRRIYRVRAGAPLVVGQELFADDLPGQASGTVVNAAGEEALAVLPIEAVTGKVPVRVAPGGEAIEVLPLPFAR